VIHVLKLKEEMKTEKCFFFRCYGRLLFE